MSDFSNTNGRGQLGTDTNRPVNDGGTMALTQNRPNVSQGSPSDGSGSNSFRPALTDADREFIYEIHRAKHLDGTPLRLDELLFLRAENVRMQQQAAREFGPGSKTVAWFQEVIEAYDEEIEKAKSPLGNVVNALKTVLANKSAKDKDMQPMLVKMIGVMRQEALMGVEDDPAGQDARDLILKVIDRSSDERTAVLEDLVKKEKAASGVISEKQFSDAVITVMGAERQRELMGMNEDEEGEKRSAKARQAVIDVMHLVSERRIKAARDLIDLEKKSMGSVSDQKFQELIVSVLGDERQNQLMGLSDDRSLGLQAVLDVMTLLLKRRQAAVADLYKRQTVPGSGVTNAQVNQAIKDYDEIKNQARRMGMSVPEGDFTLGTPKIEGK